MNKNDNGINTKPNPRDCEHGQLARSCNICELQKRIEELEWELRRLQSVVGQEDFDIIGDLLGDKRSEETEAEPKHEEVVNETEAEPRNVRVTTLIKMCGQPLSITKVSNEEYALACEENRVLTVWDYGYGTMGGHRTVDVLERWVFPKVSKFPIGKVTGIGHL